MSVEETLLQSLRFRFRGIKKTGDGALALMSESDLLWQANPELNSIAIIVQHPHGNMLSRWTDLLTTDGDKPWRNRDAEFRARALTQEDGFMLWEEGWSCCLIAVDGLTEPALTNKITIRGRELDVIDACLRQIGHYGYHVGQIVQIAKERLGDRWQTLSIARGKSGEYEPRKKD